MRDCKLKTSLKKSEAVKLELALQHLEREDLDSQGFLSESTKGLVSKLRPQLKKGTGNG